MEITPRFKRFLVENLFCDKTASLIEMKEKTGEMLSGVLSPDQFVEASKGETSMSSPRR